MDLKDRMGLVINKRLKEAIRRHACDALASAGCGCCRNYDKYYEAIEKLSKLLDIPMYPDGSGYDFWQFCTPKEEEESE